jgi:hypothetical protein
MYRIVLYEHTPLLFLFSFPFQPLIYPTQPSSLTATPPFPSRKNSPTPIIVKILQTRLKTTQKPPTSNSLTSINSSFRIRPRLHPPQRLSMSIKHIPPPHPLIKLPLSYNFPPLFNHFPFLIFLSLGPELGSLSLYCP